MSIPYFSPKVNYLFDFIKFVCLFALIDSVNFLSYTGTVQEAVDGTNEFEPAFFSSTRGQIITLLRRSSHTVEELAQALDLTHTMVRVHFTTLERDGFPIASLPLAVSALRICHRPTTSTS